MKFPFLDIFSRANIDIVKAAAREANGVLADGEITPKELIVSGADLAHAALNAYGVADRVVVNLSDSEAADVAAAVVLAIETEVKSALADRILTAAEVVDLTETMGLAMLSAMTRNCQTVPLHHYAPVAYWRRGVKAEGPAVNRQDMMRDHAV